MKLYPLTLLTLPSLLMMGSCAPPTDQPNIILILADDMGYGDLECYNAESKVPTPHLNQMARDGIRFTDAHSPSAVCSPTRYGILTGRYAWRSPLKSAVLWAWDSPLIEPERFTIGEMMQEKGYYTACIGKWHLGWNWSTSDGSSINDSLAIGTKNGHPYRRNFAKKVDFTQPIKGGPTERGFNYYFGDDVPNFPPFTFFENDHLVALPDTGTAPGEFGTPGPKLKGWRREEVMPALTARAVEFIKSQPDDQRFGREKGQPFFLYFPLTAPHTPIAPDQPFIGKSAAGRYGDYVNEVDWTVGQIMEALQVSGQLDNTLIIFTSDNGSPERDGTGYAGAVGSVRKYGHLPNYNWRGTKSEIWEGGHRVPFMVQWAKHVTPGSIGGQTICHIDIAATLADLLDFDIPEGGAPDSYSMLPLWLGKEKNYQRPEPIVLHSIHGMFALRQENWIFIDGKGSGGWSGDRHPDEWPGQLYDLQEDPCEQNNLFASDPDLVKWMLGELERIRKEDK